MSGNLNHHKRRLSIVCLSLLISACSTSLKVDTHHLEKSDPTPSIKNTSFVTNSPNLIIHTLPVGAGNCQIMSCPNEDKIVVFDCGSTGSAEQSWNVSKIQEYLRDIGVQTSTRITVSISHPDADHYNFIPDLFTQPVSSIYASGDTHEYSQAMRNWFTTQSQNGVRIQRFTEPQHSTENVPDLGCKNNVWSRILAVAVGSSKNARSMVVAIGFNHAFQAIFTGDMTDETEQYIADNLSSTGVIISKTNFITGAHHGASTHGSNSAQWVKDNHADVAVFSSGTRHNHPRCLATEKYEVTSMKTVNHTYTCGNANTPRSTIQTDRAVFGTLDNGLLLIEASPTGGFKFHPQR